MRKLLFIPILALSLGGCAQLSAAFGTYKNPVGITTLYDLEAGYYTAEQVALVYMALPLCHTGTVSTLNAPCGRRSIKLNIQDKGRVAQMAVVGVRTFVKNNPTINPITAVQDAAVLLANFQAAISAAVPVK
jgi:hypothetical protein